jgi:DNA polymerase-1
MTMNSDPTLLIVDGTAVAYRAFYAIAGLTTSSGQPTNAVFGFIRMFRQLDKMLKPTYRVVVFDGGLPVERTERCPEYKAQRTPMPDDLRAQFEPIEEYLLQAQVPSVRILGQEADDVMASMADSAEREGMSVAMATSDKDLFQLVSDKVFIVSPSKVSEKMGPQEVFVKTGVRPEKIVEWQALIGDTVDNIAGVPGIGPKTAARLLETFGTVEQLLARVQEVQPERIRKLLEEHQELIRRNLCLMKLRTDLTGYPSWDAMRTVPEDPSRLVPYFEKLDLHSLAEELKQGPVVAAPQPSRPKRQKPAADQRELFLFDPDKT